MTPDILASLGPLLSNANDLLTESAVKEINGLLGNANDLLTADSAKDIGGLLASASGLPTRKFVHETQRPDRGCRRCMFPFPLSDLLNVLVTL